LERLSRSTTFLTLKEADGLREGNNVVFPQSRGISQVRKAQSCACPDSSRTWHVRKPKGELFSSWTITAPPTPLRHFTRR
jgi:hypothetical protein